MPVRYLLDTNMASYVIKGKVPHVRERLVKLPMSEVGISVVAEAELRFGVAKQPEAARLAIAVEESLLLRPRFCLGPRKRRNPTPVSDPMWNAPASRWATSTGGFLPTRWLQKLCWSRTTASSAG